MKQELAQLADRENAGQCRHQPQVDAHIAVQNMAEFMGHHALQLVPVQLRQGALGDHQHRPRRRGPGHERIDAGLAGQHIGARHNGAGGQAHLLDHIAQAALRRVAAVAGDFPGAEHCRQALAAVAKLPGLTQGTRQQQPQGAQRDPPEGVAGEPAAGGRPRQRPPLPGQPAGQVHRRHHSGQGEQEVERQQQRAPPGPFLMLEEVHRRGVRR